MSGIPSNLGQRVSSDDAIAEAYRLARESDDDPIFANAPFIELGPTGREWSMITLVDLQTACALGSRDSSTT